MTFRTMTLADALIVSHRMRAEHLGCCEAVLGTSDPDTLAISRFQAYGPAWTLLDEIGEPVAICGLAIESPWIGVAWVVAAKGISLQSWRKLLRQARTVAQNALDPEHPQHRHRIEAYVLAEWAEAKAFAKRIGFQYEGTKHSAGRGGEDIEVWAMWRQREKQCTS